MAINLAAHLPTRKEALTGLLYGILVFILVLTFGYLNGKEPLPPAPSGAVGSIVISPDLTRDIASGPLPKNWEEHTEVIDGLRLPFINEKKERVFELYKRPLGSLSPTQAGKPELALLVMGLAYDSKNTQDALSALPPEAGIAIRPDAPYRKKLYPIVANDRRELWLHLPSENKNADYNEGVNALKTNTPTRGNIDLLHKSLSALHYYAGVTLSPDSLLPASSEDISPVIAELAARGIGFMTPDETPSLLLMQEAEEIKLPYMASGINISVSPMPDAIRKKLDDTLAIARASGNALAVVPDINIKTIEIVKEWLALNKDQFTFVPPSALAN